MTSDTIKCSAECPPEDKKNQSGPDGSLAWLVAAACSWFSFFAWLPVVCSPVLYAGYMDQHPTVPRRSASWPFTVMMVVINLGGVFYALGAERLTEQCLTLLAAVLCTASLILSSFADNVLLLVIFLGIAYGLGVASTSIIPTVLVIQHFNRYRATALALVSGTVDISGISTPSLTQLLVDKYGFSGCLLILGGLSFNLFIACFFLKRPPWIRKDDDTHSTRNLDADSPISYRDLRMKELANESCCTGDMDAGRRASDRQRESGGDALKQDGNVLAGYSLRDDERKLVQASRPTSSETAILPASGAEFRCDWQPRLTAEGKARGKTAVTSGKNIGSYCYLAGFSRMDFLKRLRSASTTYLWLVCVSKGASNLCSYTFSLILVDYAHDVGVGGYEAAALPAFFSAGCLCGTLLTGTAVDGTWVSKHSALTFSFILHGAAFAVVSWWDTYPYLGTGSFLAGFGRGIRCFLFPLLISDRCDLRELPVAFSIMNVVSSAALFLRTPILGLLRDRSGSYVTLLLTLATVNVVQLVLWLCHVALADCHWTAIRFDRLLPRRF